ncbi:MAG: pseudouridine synthase [Ornithinimicrobium sp.]|uniref:pseudouridine synthase n=1 Tax=Ornithinimicrobium sp. TaxID=1977084 RepID=UPI0026E007DB|nr:pseudouridine synthase [Ornithinimicrobium sp.]MDO5740902.1 pseudouridine synthase [Ornithinimicrobium sp.]
MSNRSDGGRAGAAGSGQGGRGRRGGPGGSDGGGRPRPAAQGGSAGPRRAGGTTPPRRRAQSPTTPAKPARSRGSSTAPLDVHDPEGIRLQKLLAAAGFGSRRACEKLIEAGRVEVDGQIVTELGVRVDPAKQTVNVDGDRVVVDSSKVYLAFNKPLGVVSSMHDEEGRPDLSEYVGHLSDRLFHVGRLDAQTEGLLLLTNDGDLAHRLQHPSYGVPKTYVAQVAGPVARDVGRTLRAGVELEDGIAKADSFKLIDSMPGRAIVEVVLHEGRKHIVRRMMEAVGYPVLALARVGVGPIQLGDLRSGRYRVLTSEEVARLYRSGGE